MLKVSEEIIHSSTTLTMSTPQAPRVMMYKDINPDLFFPSAIQKNGKTGLKIPLTYSLDKLPILFQTPPMKSPFGISIFKDGGSITCEVESHSAFDEWLIDVNESLVDTVHSHAEELWKKKEDIGFVDRILSGPYVKEGEYGSKFRPSLIFKGPKGKKVLDTRVFDINGKPVPGNDVLAESTVSLICELVHVHIASDKEYSWICRCYQIQILEEARPKLGNACAFQKME